MSDPLSSAPPVADTEMLEEAVATTEIFRYCALIYLFRVVHGESVPLDASAQGCLDEAFKLLPRVPEYFHLYTKLIQCLWSWVYFRMVTGRHGE